MVKIYGIINIIMVSLMEYNMVSLMEYNSAWLDNIIVDYMVYNIDGIPIYYGNNYGFPIDIKYTTWLDGWIIMEI